MKNNVKTVFISYSQDSYAHKQWVRKLSSEIEERGIKTILDQKDLVPGEMMTHFMEKSIHDSDFVLMIFTDKYKDKANSRKAGVGYEGSIITGDLYINQNQRKYIPILASKTWSKSTPEWALGKYGIDMSSDSSYETGLEQLISTINASDANSPEISCSNNRPGLNTGQASYPLRNNDKKMLINNISDLSVGDSLLYGSYKQKNDSRNDDPIEWQVLAKEPDKILLISK